MYCAECGDKMIKRLDGAWNICCNGIGYWDKVVPLPPDRWWPVTKHKDFYFFPTVKWPAGKVPILPKD